MTLEKIVEIAWPGAVLNRKDLCAYVGLSISTIKELEAAGEFPHRIRLSRYRVGWLTREVDRWLAERAAQREEEF